MDRQVITSRVAGSQPRFVEYAKAPEGAPNVVMVVLDDVGFAQLGCFGATIAHAQHRPAWRRRGCATTAST